MANTLIARLEHPNQYDKKSRTVVWKDGNANRWIEVYGKLQKDDNAIYFATKSEKKILIGKIHRFNKNESTIVTDIEEYPIRNDDFLKIDAFHPEANARTKANYHPYMSPLEIDIEKVKSEIKAKEFVSFYIIRKDEFNGFIPQLKENDRVILLTEQNRFSEFGKWENGEISALKNVPEIFNVQNKSLSEILEIQKKFERTNLIRGSSKLVLIREIMNTFSQGNSYFKFKSFSSYYNIIHNKRIYLRLNNIESNNKLLLNIGNYKIYKISHGKDFSQEDVTKWTEQKIVVVHGETGKGRGELFVKNLDIGDYFYLCRANNNFIVLGRITGKAKRLKNKNLEDGYFSRTYKIVRSPINEDYYKGEKRGWTPNYVSAIYEIDESELKDANNLIFKPFFNVEITTNMKTKPLGTKLPTNRSNLDLNLIFYGPPGTGKTYNTVNKALEIIGVNTVGKKRDEILNIFKKFKNEGQIEFITFHQSMSYEDFIEGIKPDETEGKITYSVKDGIFKQICLAALTPNEKGFVDAYSQLVKDLSDRQNDPMEVKTQTGKKFGITLNSNDNLNLHTGQNLTQQGSLRKENIQKYLQNDYQYKYWDSYFKGVTDLLKTNYGFSASINTDKKNYVLIIDEINRGNISQIFGELITLIEEDKRLGQKEALEVLLPYSREKFGVPSNLYILATMNTADRSVEALDAALRRRFSFEFMPPIYDLVEFPKKIKDIDIPDLLITINKGISYLLDEDHQIGHSYFMKVKDENGLREVFRKNVIPLLKEYFYNDLGKIYMILGEKFVEIRESIPHFAGGSNDEIERTTYHIKEIDDSFPIIEAVKSILAKKQ